MKTRKIPTIKCYLDGKLIHDVLSPQMQALYASAVLDQASRDTILKVVNVAPTAQSARLNLNGVSKVMPAAQWIVLTSENPEDENTLDEPAKVSPVTTTIENVTGSFEHSFHPNSLSVLRIKAGE